MKSIFRGKQISGTLTVVPKEIAYFRDEIPNFAFPPQSSMKLQKMLGLASHRYLTRDGVTGSDLALHGIRHLIETGAIHPEEIDALLYVTQTPDFFVPPTSQVMQGSLGLREDVLCMDINQGCAGFLLGLMQAFLLLDVEGIRKVLLVNADTCSRQTNPRDRNTFPLVGDAASVTLVERGEGEAWLNLKMDGSRWQALSIPAGAYRQRPSATTAEVREVGDGNFRSLENIHMDGNAIFNFTMNEVPALVEETLAWSGHSRESIEWYLFHQPNRFILEKLADVLKVPREKLPNQITSIYGNTSSASIPLTICHTIGDEILRRAFPVCLSGFGVGLSWGAMVARLGPFRFCELLEF
jgi:3-oxoacyl-[acyl-carrier-protein] synthase III